MESLRSDVLPSRSSQWSPFGKRSLSGCQRSTWGGSSTGRSSNLNMSALSVGSGHTWAVPRQGFLSNLAISAWSQYIYIPDFGPPPNRLPVSLHRFWPSGGTTAVKSAGGAAMASAGDTSMSMVSDGDVSSKWRSGAMSPTRSVVSFSGVSGYGKGQGLFVAPSNVVHEPPFLYGKLNAGAFFGHVAMGLSNHSPSNRLRPASVKATGPCPPLVWCGEGSY